MKKQKAKPRLSMKLLSKFLVEAAWKNNWSKYPVEIVQFLEFVDKKMKE